eukprot:249054-Chlamydomonas_euryale.AAC.14
MAGAFNLPRDARGPRLAVGALASVPLVRATHSAVPACTRPRPKLSARGAGGGDASCAEGKRQRGGGGRGLDVHTRARRRCAAARHLAWHDARSCTSVCPALASGSEKEKTEFHTLQGEAAWPCCLAARVPPRRRANTLAAGILALALGLELRPRTWRSLQEHRMSGRVR